MKLVSREGKFSLESTRVSLRNLRGVVNGVPLDTPLPFKFAFGGLYYARCIPEALGDGSFCVEITQEDERRIVVRYWLDNLPDDFVLDSFGLSFAKVSNLRDFLRSGYFSWDGSYYVQPEQAPNTRTQGYALTQLLPRAGEGSIVLGFDRHDRFQQTFTLDSSTVPARLTVETLWDRKDRRGLERCESERLLILEYETNDHEAALREWASAVAEVMQPRLSAPPIYGWCSWYNLYAAINEDNILEHLRGVREVAGRENLPLWVFQIDDGFTPEMGDWLDVKPQFPRGMKPLLDDIRAAGFTPGLWIAPFMVGNRSRLYREHPDWVVKDRLTGQPLAHMKFYGEFRWHKRSEEYYILDATHPEAFEYLRRVFRTWRHEWGCEYFKTDFMHFGSEYGPDRAVWHQSGSSRIEIWRRVAEMIREEIGDAAWLGCGCPLWASVGLVDGIRIGRDVGVQWSGDYSAQSLLRDQMMRNFGGGILWQSDPDCILLRDRFHNLTDTEVQSLALYAGMAAGLVMTSDSLDELLPERLALLKFLLPEPSRRNSRALCRFPLLGQAAPTYSPDADSRREWRSSDPVIVQVRSSEDVTYSALFLLNTADDAVERVYTLEQLGLPAPAYAYNWTAGTTGDAPVEQVSVTLPPHGGALFILSAERLTEVPAHLP
jgi:hypothetical protein